MQIPSPGAVCPATVMYGLRIVRRDFSSIVPPTRKTIVRGPSASHVNEPMLHAPIKIVSAGEAYELVLASSGATLPKRDAVDERIIKTVRTGAATAKAEPELATKLEGVKFSPERIREMVELVGKGIITDPDQVGGYPDYKGTPYMDSDDDGMPDEWESKQGLNPNDAGDASGDKDNDGYTNIEAFLNGAGA